jgi:hypothetical protein
VEDSASSLSFGISKLTSVVVDIAPGCGGLLLV